MHARACPLFTYMGQFRSNKNRTDRFRSKIDQSLIQIDTHFSIRCSKIQCSKTRKSFKNIDPNQSVSLQ